MLLCLINALSIILGKHKSSQDTHCLYLTIAYIHCVINVYYLIKETKKSLKKETLEYILGKKLCEAIRSII